MNTENSKMNGPHKIVLNLSKRLDLGSSNKQGLDLICCSSKLTYLFYVEKYKTAVEK